MTTKKATTVKPKAAKPKAAKPKAAKPRARVARASSKSEVKTSARRKPVPANPRATNGPCLIVPSDPAEHAPALAAAPIVAGAPAAPAAAPAAPGAPPAPPADPFGLPAFLKRDGDGVPGFARGEGVPAVDRPSAIVALAALMDQRASITTPSERYMLDHGVPVDEIVRLREQEAEIVAAIEGAKPQAAEDGTPRRSSTKSEAFKWLIDTKTNPNREGSQRWDGFVLLRDCANLAEFYQKGGKPDFIRWALHKKWIEVS